MSLVHLGSTYLFIVNNVYSTGRHEWILPTIFQEKSKICLPQKEKKIAYNNTVFP